MQRINVVAAVAAGLVVVVATACNEPKQEPLARGKELYDACMPCHGKDGTGVPVAAAPEIAGLPEWYIEAQVLKFRAGKRGYHFDDLAGLRMRPMSLSMSNEEDVHDVSMYIATLPRAPHNPTVQGGSADHGKQLFTSVCVTCHGADAAGNKALNAPMLAGADDWYLLAQLGKFKNKLRGDGAIDPVGATMQAMSMTLTDDQAMKDVVAYIKTLPPPAAPPKG